MRNLLPMETAPRDGTKIVGAWKNCGGVYYATCSRCEQYCEWVGSDGIAVVVPDAWHPLPGTIIPMSTAWRDGRRIQVAVFRGTDLTSTWEHVEWQVDEAGVGAWWGDWMMGADPNECIEDNWRGWWPTPGEE